MLKKSPRDKSLPLPDDERCVRNDGKQWRCSQRRAAGQSKCDYHLQYSRSKSRSATKASKGDSKSNFRRKDEVKSGTKSRRPVKLKSTARDFYESSDEYSFGEDTSTEKASPLLTSTYFQINMNKKTSERRRTSIIPSKEWTNYLGSHDKSDDEEENDMEQLVGEKRKSISSEKIGNKGKQIIDLSGTEYNYDDEEENDMDQRVGDKRKSISLEKVEKIENKGKLIDLFGTEYNSDGEEVNYIDQRVGGKRRSISLEKVEKIENKGKQINDLSGIKYKSSSQKGLDSKEKPELSKKIFEGVDPHMCSQCQRNDEGKVITCVACKKERLCVPCVKRLQNPMDSNSETRNEENEAISNLKLEIAQIETVLSEKISKGERPQMCNQCQQNDEGMVISCMACTMERYCVPCITCWRNHNDSDAETRNGTISDLKLEITRLESELLREKLRHEHLRTENDMYKSECSNLKKLNAGLEKGIKKFREKEAKNLKKITKLFGMMTSYDEKVTEFMKKHGDENSSLRERIDAIVVKKEIEDNSDDEVLNQIKDIAPFGAESGDDDNMVVQWSKKKVLKEMWRRLHSSASSLMPFQN